MLNSFILTRPFLLIPQDRERSRLNLALGKVYLDLYRERAASWASILGLILLPRRYNIKAKYYLVSFN
jgi:hypothetical protein